MNLFVQCPEQNEYRRTMLHDEAIFPDPSLFNPGRFLNPDGMLRKLERWEDPSVIGFGFGRRYAIE